MCVYFACLLRRACVKRENDEPADLEAKDQAIHKANKRVNIFF